MNNENKNYPQTKVYFDGRHYIGIPKDNFPHGKRCKIKKTKDCNYKQNTCKEMFDIAYKESQSLPKKERKKYIVEQMKDTFSSDTATKNFVEQNIDRKKINAIKRKSRLMRKVYLQKWNFFVTLTYDSLKHTEESFKIKLLNTLKHLVSRKARKYIGIWVISPNQRLHFHGIFYIPDSAMIGELVKTTDYSIKSKKLQITYQKSHFMKHFGRNDFKELGSQKDIVQSIGYILKYIEKSGERLMYGGKLPTYFVSDIIADDIIYPIGIDDKKVLLFDNFTCIDYGEILGLVSQQVTEQLPKCN
mgnify:CR=1 FL=1